MTYTREYLQALSDKGYKTIPSSAFTIDEVLDLYARIDELESKLTDANAGAKLMHSLATGGESRLDADLAAMLQWEDEKPITCINWQNYPDFEDEPKEAQPKIDFNSVQEIKF